ncbi:MAG: hypothetical protein HY558_01770 [Euryarchaeota archaeon]|nr:hypothetical protein [Euryarchaeota archaeon]
MALSPSERDNLTRWNGRRPGHYEVYYLKFNQPDKQAAAWLRYTLLSPQAGKGEPVAEVWAIAFEERGTKTTVAKQTYPASQATLGRDRFRFKVGDSELTHSHATGKITGPEGTISWDLSWKPNPAPLRHLPYGWMYKTRLVPTKVTSPGEDIRATGRLEVNGRTLQFQEAPGQETHHWGSRHAGGWVWAHCNAFTDAPGVVFDGFTAMPRKPSRPQLTILYARVEGQDILLNRLRDLRETKSEYSLGQWCFVGQTQDLRIEGEIDARPEQMVCLHYKDPDQTDLYCCNTKLADMTLKVYQRQNTSWSLWKQYKAEGTAALELTRRRPEPRVKIRA